ncbi:MAG: sulfite exporter TauE/SafE family protein [Chitinophagales bacterium]
MNTSVAFSSSFLLGALHALEPSHDKSFLAAYTIGKKIDKKHILTLCVSLMISHFTMLVLVAILLKYMFANVDSHFLYDLNSKFVPFAILIFGAYLLKKAFSSQKNKHKASCSCSAHQDKKEEKQTTTKKMALVGMIGGFIPCPTAIVPLMISGITDNFANALLYILVYVLGMSVVLGIMIVTFYYTQNYLLDRFKNLKTYLHSPFLSAILVIAVGLIYLGFNIFVGHAHHV